CRRAQCRARVRSRCGADCAPQLRHELSFLKMADEIVALEFEKPIADLESKIEELRSCAATEHMDLSEEIRTLEEKCEELKSQIYGSLSPWQRVMIARHPQRPYTLHYI